VLAWLSQPWPWYVTGPLIGLVVPVLLLLGGRSFGISSSLQDLCAATVPGRLAYFRYDWRANAWRLAFVAGIVLGGALGATLLRNPDPYVNVSADTVADLQGLGLRDLSGLVPAELVSWRALLTLPGFVAVVVGGFLVGFGARYAGGCTSGHAITGLATFQLASLFATLGFFAGGLAATHLILPLLLAGRGP
jgi:uncharacterized membrane protein YedE/YeeE